MLDNALTFVKKLVAAHAKPGDTVIDATTGNGHDALFLAEVVGETGKVYGFDIQEQAVLKTREILLKNDFEHHAEIIHAGHERMEEFVKGKVSVIMFNLGYLPHGDRTIITKTETTLQALTSALKLLKIDGIITLIGYTGHDNGGYETEAVWEFSKNLDKRYFRVMEYRAVNMESAPIVIAIERYAATSF